ncbi:MAG: hypothetical protein ACP5PJ_10525 [Acidimicrobiales bacterium]
MKSIRQRRTLGLAAVGAATIGAGLYGGLAYASTGSGGSPGVPASLSATSTHNVLTSSSTTTKPHRRRLRAELLHGGYHATLSFWSTKLGTTVTFTVDAGQVTAASASSITVLEPNGAHVTEAIGSSTHFGRVSLSTIESDVTNGTGVHARLIQRDGVLMRVMAFTPKTSSPAASTSASVSA